MRGEVVAAEVGDQRGQLVVGDVGDAASRDLGRRAVQEPLAQRVGPVSPNSDWYCSLGIASIQARSALAARPGERRLQPAAVLDLDDVPAGRLELAAPLVDPDARARPGPGTAG